MKRKTSLLAALALGFVMAFSSAAISADQTTFVTIGTGGVTGVYLSYRWCNCPFGQQG